MAIDYVRTGPFATFTLRHGRANPLTGLFRMQHLGRSESDAQDSFLCKR
ncbi:MAG: hypothetical protein MUQ32_01040 [Chloroflexi bacterium]|nr:hypothetical protein [Chloroflexota bacterium]